MNIEDEKMDFPLFKKKKKIFKVGTWIFIKGGVLTKKIFYALNESRRWENGFPTIFEKFFFFLNIKNLSRWTIDRKN